MGSGIGEGLGSMLLLNRARSEEGRGQETDEDFRWIFDANVTRAFVAGKRPVGARELGSKAGDEAFEAVLFETMRLFAMTPHVDTREATLQMLYTILQVIDLERTRQRCGLTPPCDTQTRYLRCRNVSAAYGLYPNPVREYVGHHY